MEWTAWAALTNETATDGIRRLREELVQQGITNRIVTLRGVRTLLVGRVELARAKAVLHGFVSDSDLVAMGEI